MSCNCGSSDKVKRVRPDGSYTIVDVIKDTLSGTIEYVSNEVQYSRIAVCKTCINRLTNIVDTCKLCGCVIVVKVKYLKSACPINKW